MMQENLYTNPQQEGTPATGHTQPENNPVQNTTPAGYVPLSAYQTGAGAGLPTAQNLPGAGQPEEAGTASSVVSQVSLQGQALNAGANAAANAPSQTPVQGQTPNAQANTTANDTPQAPGQQAHTPNPNAAWTPYAAGQQYGRYTHQPQAAYPGGQPQGPVQSAPKQAKKSGGRVVSAVALVLACGVFGFGGSFAANQIHSAQNGTAVVYKVPETTDADPAATNNNLSISDIAAKAGQSVVSVRTESATEDPYFGNQTYEGAGSGVIFTEDGYIITNHHVVNGATQVVVTLPDGSEHEAVVVGADARSDIAVLKINVTGLVPAVIGDNEKVRVGDLCIAIGNPMGQLGGTVTDGIISALNREVNIEGTPMNLIQMSAAVSPGNSGGGLFNGNGELVGIVNAKAGSENTEGLGFAIPANTAAQVAQQLMEDGYVKGRPALGITAQQINIEGTGQTVVVVAGLTPGGSAEVGGLQEGDIILSIDGEDVSTLAGLTNALDAHAVGDEVELEVQRGEQNLTVTLTLQELVPETTPVSGA